MARGRSRSVSKTPSRSRSRKRTKSAPPTPGRRKIAVRVGTRQTRNGTGVNQVSYAKKFAKGGRKRYAMTGFVHSHTDGYVGPFKKPKAKNRKHAEKFEKYGVVYKREHFAQVSDTECAYVLQGLPAANSATFVTFAIYRYAMMKAGFPISNWHDTIFLSGIVSLNWKMSPATSQSGANTPLFGTHYETALSLHGAVQAALVEADSDVSIQFVKCLIGINDAGGPTNYRHIDLQDSRIEFEYFSTIKIKNQTLANTLNNAEDTDNIYHQPLVGYVYENSAWKNGFMVPGGDLGANNTINADPVYGAAQATAGFFSLNTGAAGNLNPYRKPPPAYMLGCKKSARIRLNPGEIKSMKCSFKSTMKLNTLVNKLINEYVRPTNGQKITPLGKCQLVAFERELEVGNAMTLVTLAYEVNYTLRTRVIPFNPRANHIVDTTD